ISSSIHSFLILVLFFFFNDTATTEIYTLSLHDALPISRCWVWLKSVSPRIVTVPATCPTNSTARSIHSTLPRLLAALPGTAAARSEEHTSELQSRSDLVCRLLLEKKKKQTKQQPPDINR